MRYHPEIQRIKISLQYPREYLWNVVDVQDYNQGLRASPLMNTWPSTLGLADSWMFLWELLYQV